MFGGCRGSNLGGAGLGRWAVIEELEVPSFEGRWDRNMEEEYWVFHIRHLEGRCFGIVMRRRVRIVRVGAGGRHSWDRRGLFAVQWVAGWTS
jgi:hypothetical protein